MVLGFVFYVVRCWSNECRIGKRRGHPKEDKMLLGMAFFANGRMGGKEMKLLRKIFGQSGIKLYLCSVKR